MHHIYTSFVEFLIIENELETCGTMTNEDIFSRINAEISDEETNYKINKSMKILQKLRNQMNCCRNLLTKITECIF